ncbi:MAG: glycosyltransferase family 2 protein, partial [Gaiellales bacterium]
AETAGDVRRAKREGKLAAMLRGAEAATGEILVFSDANNSYAPGTLSAIVAPFADPGVGVTTGRKIIDEGDRRSLDHAEGLYWRYESKLKAWESATGSVSGVSGEVIAFRAGSFPELDAGTMNEDFAQAMTAAVAGWRVVYAPEAISVERASATVGDELVRRSRLVTGRGQALARLLPGLARHDPDLAFRVISHKGLRPLVPFAMIAAIVSNALLVRDRRSSPVWVTALAAAQVGFYTAAAAGWLNERHGRRNRALYLPYYFCRANAATLRGCADFVLGRHEAVWTKVRRA